MQRGIGDDDVEQHGMPVGQRDEIAERVVLGQVVEDQVGTDIAADYCADMD